MTLQIKDWKIFVAICAAMFFAWNTAHAQVSGGLQFVQPDSPLACLTQPPQGKPEYPKDELLVKEGGSVELKITFTSPDTRPSVKVVRSTGAEAFQDSATDYVRQYRLPCMAIGDVPVVAEQTFSFDPGDGRKVHFTEPSSNYPRFKQTCVTNSWTGPNYPKGEGASGRGGNVLVEVAFHISNVEPEVKVIFDANSPALTRSVTSFAKNYRFTCPISDGKPVLARQIFKFRVSDGPRMAFKDLDFKSFLNLVDPAGVQGAKFDLTQMGCPFDVHFVPYLPYTDNVVGEYGESTPNRAAFLKWVKTLTLRMPKHLESYLIGEPIKVAVPCLVLDL